MNVKISGFLIFGIILICGSCEKKYNNDLIIASKRIGIEGGTLVVNDPNSPLFGLKIDFPESSLDQNVIVSVELNQDAPVLNNEQLTSISEAFNIYTSGDSIFDKPITIEAPLNIDLTSSQILIPFALYYNEETETWDLLEVHCYNNITNTVSFKTTHFSTFIIGGVILLTNQIFQAEVLSNLDELRENIIDAQCGLLPRYQIYFNALRSSCENNIISMADGLEGCGDKWYCGYKSVDEWLFEEIGEALTYAAFEEGLGIIGATVVGTSIGAASGLLSILGTPCMLCIITNSIISPEAWRYLILYYYAELSLQLIDEAYNKEICDRSIEGSFTDSRDGKLYKTVKIGNQWWMAENLAYLPAVNHRIDTSFTEPLYYVSGYDGTNIYEAKALSNFETYGTLYNWTAAIDACPSGWHLPSDTEWAELELFLGIDPNEIFVPFSSRGENEAEMLKATYGWKDGGNGNNLFRFSALPGGIKDYYGAFSWVQEAGQWWTSTREYDEYSFVIRAMNYQNNKITRWRVNYNVSSSIRCIKD